MTSRHTEEATGRSDRASSDGADEGAAGAQPVDDQRTIRHRVLDAALEVFLEQDPAAVSLEAIAGRAGVSEEALLDEFGSRIELVVDLAGRLYMRRFPFDVDPQRKDLPAFMRAYLENQKRPDVRLLWDLGAQMAAARPGGPEAAYWHLVGEVELRLIGSGLGQGEAHERALVLTPALMLVADRVARDYTTADELDEFVAAACRLALRDIRPLA